MGFTGKELFTCVNYEYRGVVVKGIPTVENTGGRSDWFISKTVAQRVIALIKKARNEGLKEIEFSTEVEYENEKLVKIKEKRSCGYGVRKD